MRVEPTERVDERPHERRVVRRHFAEDFRIVVEHFAKRDRIVADDKVAIIVGDYARMVCKRTVQLIGDRRRPTFDERSKFAHVEKKLRQPLVADRMLESGAHLFVGVNEVCMPQQPMNFVSLQIAAA